MDRFLIVTTAIDADGSYRITRRLATLAAIVEHTAQHWPRSWAERDVRAMLATRGVGDRITGPNYKVAGDPAYDRVTFVGDVGDLVVAAAEGPDVRVTAAGRLCG